MVTLAREFIAPDESFACADDVLAEAADHSRDVDLTHYAVVYGSLPRITNNDMNRHRWLAEEWSSLLGMGPFPPPEPVHVSRTKARSTKAPDADELAEKLSGPMTNAVMNGLAAVGITTETVELLTRAAKQLLASQPGLLDEREPGGSAPSPRHPAHAPTFNEASSRGLCTGDVPPSPGLSDALALSPSRNRLAREARGRAVPAVTTSPSSPRPLDSSSPGRTRPIFDAMPSVPARMPAPSVSQSCLPGHQREVAEAFSEADEPPRPAKRQRLLQGHGRERRASKDEERVGDMQTQYGEDDPMADAIMPNSPLCSYAVAERSDSPMVGQEPLSLVNVPNPDMAGESDLRRNIRWAMGEILGVRDAREKSVAQMLGIVLVMREQQQKDAMITLRTGSGKSMLWLCPPLLDPKIKLLVVCPYKALLAEQCEKAKELGIRADDFSSWKEVRKDVQILFVQVEHVQQDTKFTK